MPTEKQVTNFVINKVPTKAIFEKNEVPRSHQR